MIKKVKMIFAAIVLVILGIIAMPPVGLAMAVNSQLCDDLTHGSHEYIIAGCDEDGDVGSVATTVIEVALGFIGVVAVGVVIYGGFLFLMSSGDAGKVKRGQDAIKYGLIGLVVSILAYAIVKFVSMALA